MSEFTITINLAYLFVPFVQVYTWMCAARAFVYAVAPMVLVAVLVALVVALLAYVIVKILCIVWLGLCIIHSRVQLRRSLLSIDTPDLHQLVANVSYTKDGPRLEGVDTAGNRFFIELTDHILTHVSLAYTVRTSLPTVLAGGKEMSVPGSVPFPAGRWPSGLVALTDSNAHIVGMGCRVKVDGCDYLLTAAHVISALHGRECRLMVQQPGSTGYTALPMQSDWTIAAASPSHDMDFILINVPKAAWSLLGVKALSMGKYASGMCTVNGPDAASRLQVAHGRMVKDKSKPFGLKHDASTMRGFSGTPLLVEGKVAAVHTGASGSGDVSNLATSAAGILSFLSLKESADEMAENYNRVEWDELVEDYDDVRFTVGYTARGAVRYAFHDNEFAVSDIESMRYNPVGKAWADYDDSMEDFDTVYRECAPEVLKPTTTPASDLVLLAAPVKENAVYTDSVELVVPPVSEVVPLGDEGRARTESTDFQSGLELSHLEDAATLLASPATITTSPKMMPTCPVMPVAVSSPSVAVEQQEGAKLSKSQKRNLRKKRKSSSPSSVESSGPASEQKVSASPSTSKQETSSSKKPPPTPVKAKGGQQHSTPPPVSPPVSTKKASASTQPAGSASKKATTSPKRK